MSQLMCPGHRVATKLTRRAYLTGQKIHEYFVGLGIPESEAWDLHVRSSTARQSNDLVLRAISIRAFTDALLQELWPGNTWPTAAPS